MPSTPTGPLGSQSPPSLPVGTIIGPVLGGISLLLGVAAAGFFLCRRWKRSKATQSLLLGTARRRHENGYDHHARDPGCDGDRRRDEASLIENMISTTPISPLRFHDGAATHYEDSPQASSQVSTVHSSDNTHPSRVADITASPLTAGDRSSKHRAELAWRLEALNRTRSILSSTTTGAQASRVEADSSSGRTTETAIRDLEAEIADLRASLTALNARLGDDGEGSVELLPAYAE